MPSQIAQAAAPASPPRSLDGPKAKGLRRTLRILKLILRPTEYMDDNVRRYGPMFKIGGETSPPLVYVGDPEVVRDIFALDASQASTGQSNGVLKTMVGDHSILLLDGAPHQRQRKLLMPPFHGDRLRTYAQLICDLTRQVSADWQPGQSIRARPPMQDLTLGVILQAVFGLRSGARLEELQSLMSAMLDSFAAPLSSAFLFFPTLQKDWGAWSPWGRFVRSRERIRSLLYAEIRGRRPGALIVAFSAALDSSSLKHLINEGCNGACDKSEPSDLRRAMEIVARYVEHAAPAADSRARPGMQGTLESIRGLLREWNTRLDRQASA